MSKYYVLSSQVSPENCALYDYGDELSCNYYPARGLRVGDDWPDDYAFTMSDEVPGIKITDVINNAFNYLMVSARMKQILEAHSDADVEYLRFTVLNHKGRVASDECYIANVIGTVDCVDRSRTVGEEDPTEPGEFDYLERLYLREPDIDQSLKLFRIDLMPKVIIVREDLKGTLEQHGMTGARYFKMGEELEL